MQASAGEREKKIKPRVDTYFGTQIRPVLGPTPTRLPWAVSDGLAVTVPSFVAASTDYPQRIAFREGAQTRTG